MSRRRFTPVFAILAFLCAFASAADTSAQLLDGQWFKVKVNAKGFALGVTDVTKTKLNFTVYMNFTSFKPEEGGLAQTAYDVVVFYQQSPGVWVPTSLVVEGGGGSSNLALLGSDEQFSVPTSMRFLDQDSTSSKEGSALVGFDGLFTAEFKLKTDKRGQLKSASFKSLGGTLLDGGLPDGDGFGGGFTLSAKTVPTSKLPFDLGS